MKGITLREGDQVVGLDVADDASDDEVLVVTENGYGKRTPVNDYRLSNRGGKGIKTATITEKNGNIVCITTVTGEEDLMVVTNSGVIIRIDVQDISQNGRAAQGVRLIKLSDEQFVSTVAKVDEEDEASEAVETEEATSATETGDNSEQVIADDAPGNAIHTETDSDDNAEAPSDDEPKALRQDFMDRVNEDIDNADNDDSES